MIGQVTGLPLDDKARTAMNEWLDGLTGDLAGIGDIGPAGMHLVEVGGAVDGSRSIEEARGLFASFLSGQPHIVETMGMKMTVTGKLDAGTHDGVKLSAYDTKLDLSTLPPAATEAQRDLWKGGMHAALAGWDKSMGVAIGSDAEATLGACIDASRGKGPGFVLNPARKALIDDSVHRGESMVMIMDVASLMSRAMGGAGSPPPASADPSGAVIGLGFQAGAAHLRFALPLAHLKDVKAMAGAVHKP
jgi:hypothetical protein